MNTTSARKLQERLLLRSLAGEDALRLDDATLLAALDGSKALDAAQLQQLRQSPLTLRRFRHLALARKQAMAALGWCGSRGMLRAAASGAALARLCTDDGCWSLHFIEQDGGWQVILKLDETAGFAAGLLQRQPMLRVTDGAGTVLLQGRLDADGECEGRWPLAASPMAHLQAHGARFAVEAAGP